MLVHFKVTPNLSILSMLLFGLMHHSRIIFCAMQDRGLEPSPILNRNLTLCLPMPTKLLALPPSIDIHQALGSPSGRAGAKRLRGLTTPILPTGYPQIHCTDSLYETAFLHELSARPLSPSLREVPLPKGRGKNWVETSNSLISRNLSFRPPTPTKLLALLSCVLFLLRKLFNIHEELQKVSIFFAA